LQILQSFFFGTNRKLAFKEQFEKKGLCDRRELKLF